MEEREGERQREREGKEKEREENTSKMQQSVRGMLRERERYFSTT